jgi:hypothetical protein
MNRKPIRHGDLGLFPVDKLPEGLTASKSKVIMSGSHGNNHSFDTGVFCPKEIRQGSKFIIGYYIAGKGSNLLHTEHGCKKDGTIKQAPIQEGVWECRGQVEATNQGMSRAAD